MRLRGKPRRRNSMVVYGAADDLLFFGQATLRDGPVTRKMARGDECSLLAEHLIAGIP